MTVTLNGAEAGLSHLLIQFHSSQIVLPCIQNSMKEISMDIPAYGKFLWQIPNKAGSLAIAIAASLPGQTRPDTQQQTIFLPYGDGTPYEESQNNWIVVCTHGDSAKPSETQCKDDTAEVKITFCELNYMFMALKNILKMDQTSSCRKKTNGRIEIILEQIRTFETENSNIQSVPGVKSKSFTFPNIQKWPSCNHKSLTGTHNSCSWHTCNCSYKLL